MFYFFRVAYMWRKYIDCITRFKTVNKSLNSIDTALGQTKIYCAAYNKVMILRTFRGFLDLPLQCIARNLSTVVVTSVTYNKSLNKMKCQHENWRGNESLSRSITS